MTIKYIIEAGGNFDVVITSGIGEDGICHRSRRYRLEADFGPRMIGLILKIAIAIDGYRETFLIKQD
jgi:hypothetical protein